MVNDILVIFTLIVMEGILSIDNAAVLATMVKHLPKDEQTKALRYGLLGAYVFRGVALFLAAYIVKFAIFKLFGGMYLAYLAYAHFFRNKGGDDTTTTSVAKSFWATVAHSGNYGYGILPG